MVCDGEGELPEGAVSILPPGMSLLQEIVCHGLDDLVWCSGHEADGQIIEYYLAYLDTRGGQRDLLIVRGEPRYRLDLAGVAAAIEFHDNRVDPRRARFPKAIAFPTSGLPWRQTYRRDTAGR